MTAASSKWEAPIELLKRAAPKAPCQLYTAIQAEHDRATLVRSHLERLWTIYRPYATKHFYDQFPLHTQDRFWEMYLAAALLQRDFKLSRLTDNAPDVGLTLDCGQKVWFEAVAPGPGVPGAPDSVPPLEPMTGRVSIARQFPEEQILLRLTQALREKRRQRARQMRGRLVGLRDAYVIAINVGGIPEAWWGAQIPTILKALFPIGHMTVSFDLESRVSSRIGWSSRPQIEKSGGGAVATTLFANPRGRGVSAVLYSTTHLGRLAHDAPVEPGSDFVLVHNPFATVPLRRGFVGGVEEWEAEESGDGFMVVRPHASRDNKPSQKGA
ncbi:hypothetical protein KTR66_03795 [Roseococcus sp. SDR]|uniref:hypothetical protein n=1 Tax=Roseococcus sp. SDR TaxID=2835532 RepID=UPI001BCFE29D|nr:hypothetical protein [Roseococcus sp. SDR]MBS7789102.1 hypothetical protein [Roseococcus sp. SDR]MBV1844416.1 hypothetical protein [Roseococcus sp. SDR]